jgi:conjugative relaxase-like TrwC/TraI family protein
MYTLTPVSIAITDYLYSEETVTVGDPKKLTNYLSMDSLSVPTWYGKALTHFGLQAGDAVDKKILEWLLSLSNPSSNLPNSKSKRPVKRAGRKSKYIKSKKKEKQKCAIELGFGVPKSYSSLFALAPSEIKQKLIDGVHDAVKYTLNEVEARSAFMRRGKGGHRHEKANGLVFAIFTHITSRAVDPHIHAHVVAITKNSPRFDGTFGALEERYFYMSQKEMGLIFQARLAENVRALGYDTIFKDGSFEIVGIPDSLISCWSKRRIQVVKEMIKKNMIGPNAGNIAARNTRAKKKVHHVEKLFEQWEQEAIELGIDINDIKCLNQKSFGIHINDENLLEFPELSAEFLSTKLVENKSVFTERNAYEQAASLALKSGQSITVALNAVDELLNSDLVVELEAASRFTREFTTPPLLKLERQLIRHAKSLSKSSFKSALTKDELIKFEILSGLSLSEEQKEAVLGATDNRMLAIINGSAGSGKSTIMKVVRDVYHAKNSMVYGAAIAKSAAKNLQSASGVESKTIAMTLLELDAKKSTLQFGDVLIIDEAGQLGLNDALSLIGHAKRIGFKLLMIGEDKQLEAIDHGGVLSYLSRPDVIGTARIETIRRQNSEWDRKAVASFRDGFAKNALELYKQHNRLHFADSVDNAQKRLIEDWWQDSICQESKETMILARTWRHVEKLNLLVRAKLQNADKIGTENIAIQGVVGGRALDFQLSENERIRFTRNNYPFNFTNGDLGTVTNIDTDIHGQVTLTVQCDGGAKVVVNQSEYSDQKGRLYIVPAYAQTIYSAQGRAVDGNVYVLHDNAMDRKNAYVAMSRHKEQCHLYAGLEEVLGLDEVDPQKNCTQSAIDRLASQYSKEKSSSLAISYQAVHKNKQLDISEELDAEFCL